MYPFGSGMPVPVTNPSQSQPQYPQSTPFGAGFQTPTPNPNIQPPYAMQMQGTIPSHQPYPQNQQPYPSGGYPYQHNTGSTPPNMPLPPSSYNNTSTHSNIPYPQQSTAPFGAGFGFIPTNPSVGTTFPPMPVQNNSPYLPTYPPSHPTQHTYPSYPTNTNIYNQQFTLPNHPGAMPTHNHLPFTGNQPNKGTPTLIPPMEFDPVKDAHLLRKAMKGFGTDENTIINVLCRRSNSQRQEIQLQFKTNFGKDLIEDIQSETSGNFEKLLVALLTPIVDYYCIELHDAMAGVGTDEDVLIETLCTLSNHEIQTITSAYERKYGNSLESDLKSETSGNFKRLLVSLCVGGRDESGITDLAKAQEDARELLKAGELSFGTDESTFNMVLCQRNYQQLKLVFEEYEKMTGHTLEKAIKKEFSGDIEDGLIAIYKCVMNKAEYFATRLHKSMAGIGTNDRQLIRILVTRAEIDLQDIKIAFERLYGKSLKSWIKGDTSGHYKHAIYALIGEERS